jgi:hypothetical protein
MMDGSHRVNRLHTIAQGAKRLSSTPALIVGMAAIAAGFFGAPAQGEQLASRAPIGEDADSLPPADAESCARDYHRRLGRDVRTLTGEIWATALEVRKPDNTLPGRWLFWDGSGVLARTARQRKLLRSEQFLEREGRVCVHSILARGGRIRCLKWKDVPDDYEPPPDKRPAVEAKRPEITDGERRLAAAVARRVSSRGGISELAFDSAFYHLVKRAADEIDRYAGQDFKPRLCSGVPEMVAFYRKRLVLLEKKEEAARELATDALEAGRASLEVALEAAGRAAEPGAGEAVRPMGLEDLLGTVLTAEEAASLASHEPDLDFLAKAREYLTDERLDAMDKKQSGPLRKALRTAEIALYAEINADRLGQLHAAFESSFEAILEAHRASCSCGQ